MKDTNHVATFLARHGAKADYRHQRGGVIYGEATGLRTSLQTPGNTPRLQAKQNKNDDLAMCLSSKVMTS